MKIAVSAVSPSMDAQVDPRFGRCPYFLVVDDQTGDWDALENTMGDAASGAGIQAAQTVANSGADAVLTGDAGPNAFRALSAGGVAVFTGATGTVRDALEAWRSGALKVATGATTEAHAGVVQAPARGVTTKVAVATEGDHVAGHFGRCDSYTVAQVEDGVVKSREQLANPGHAPGFLPNYLADHQIQCIIAGGMGPRAIGLFAERDIDVMIGVQGPLDTVLKRYADGTLVSDPSVTCCTHGEGHSPCSPAPA